jgi:hypothetical protein
MDANRPIEEEFPSRRRNRAGDLLEEVRRGHKLLEPAQVYNCERTASARAIWMRRSLLPRLPALLRAIKDAGGNLPVRQQDWREWRLPAFQRIDSTLVHVS